MSMRSLAAPALAIALLGAAAASTGAVVLEKSPVPAQRKAFAEAAARTGVVSVGRGVMRSATRAQTQAELASAREAEAADFYRRGAGALTEK